MSANFNAYATTVQLLNGDQSAAGSWLARAEVENTLDEIIFPGEDGILCTGDDEVIFSGKHRKLKGEHI